MSRGIWTSTRQFALQNTSAWQDSDIAVVNEICSSTAIDTSPERTCELGPCWASVCRALADAELLLHRFSCTAVKSNHQVGKWENKVPGPAETCFQGPSCCSSFLQVLNSLEAPLKQQEHQTAAVFSRSLSLAGAWHLERSEGTSTARACTKISPANPRSYMQKVFILK